MSGSKVKIPHPTAGKRTKEQTMAAQLERETAQFYRAAEHYGGVDSFLKLIEEEASKKLDSRSPLTRKHHDKMKRSWTIVMKLIAQEVPENEFWTRRVVDGYAIKFIRTKTRMTPGKDGKYCKSVTVGNWVSHLIYCIAHFTYDPPDIPCGPSLLHTGLHQKLLDTYKDLVTELGLERHSNAKTASYGKNEFQLLAEHAIHVSTQRGRKAKLQTMAALFFAFGSGVRPSSLAAAHEEYRNQGKYMKLGDVTPYKRGHGTWDIAVDFKHHKGWNNRTTGFTLSNVYRGLSRVENLIFDPIWLIAYMFIRGAFKYKTLNELINSTDHELVVVNPEEPFFIQVESGGNDFAVPMVPALSANVSQWVGDLMYAVGLDKSLYAFRRGAANDFDIRLGSQKAGQLLGHSDVQTVLNKYYSLGTANIDVLAIRAGESTTPLQPGVEGTVLHHARLSAAVGLIASKNAFERLQSGGDLGKGSPKAGPGKEQKKPLDDIQIEIKKAQKEAQNSSIELHKVLEAIDDVWWQLLAPLRITNPKHTKGWAYVHKKQNVTNITGWPEYQEAINKNVRLKNASIKVEKALVTLFKERENLFRRINREISEEIIKRHKLDPPPVESYHDRDKAVEHFQEASKLLYARAPQASASSSLARTKATPGPRTLENQPAPQGPGQTKGKGKLTKVDEEKLRAEIAAMNEEDDDAEIDNTLESSRTVLDFGNRSEWQAGTDNTLDELSAPRIVRSAAEQAKEFYIGDTKIEPYNDADEDTQPMIKDLSMPDARILFLRVLLESITSQWEREEQKRLDGGKILCQKCKADPEGRKEPFEAWMHLDRHMKSHTEWKDLKMRMIEVQPGRWKCPVATCHVTVGRLSNLRRHCLNSCEEKAGFRLMKKEHDLIYKLNNLARSDSRPKEPWELDDPLDEEISEQDIKNDLKPTDKPHLATLATATKERLLAYGRAYVDKTDAYTMEELNKIVPRMEKIAIKLAQGLEPYVEDSDAEDGGAEDSGAEDNED